MTNPVSPSKKKSQIRFAAIVFVSLSVLAFLWFYSWGNGPVNRSTYDLVVRGQTEKDVEKLIAIKDGPVQRDASDLPTVVATDWKGSFGLGELDSNEMNDGSAQFFKRGTKTLVGKVRWWNHGRHSLMVVFDPEGLVIGRELSEFRAQSSWLDRLVQNIKRGV